MEKVKRKSGKKTVETEDLIRLVQGKRCLWDRTSNSYRDRPEKDRAWNEIYREIEPDYDNLSEEMKNLIGSQITRKWYNVRDSYVKSKKVQSMRQKPYLHSKLLGFLEPIYFEKSFEDSRDGEKSENDEEQWLNEVFVVDDDGNIENEAKRPKIEFINDKPKEVAPVEADDSIVNVLTNLINREDDEDRAFFRSIMPAVKKLSEESKFEFRIQLMNILKNLLNNDSHTVNLKCEAVEETDTD